MQQYGKGGGSRPYDQNRDRLRTGVPSQTGRSTSRPAGMENGYGFNGEPLSRPPSRTANGNVRRTRTDNSIEFPVQPRRQSAAGAQRSGTQQRAQRPAQQRQTPRSGAAPSRTAGSRNRKAVPQRQNAQRMQAQRRSAQQRYKNQKLRPAQQTRDPSRREKRKQRRLTRAAIRRRRIIRRLTAFALLLCVIAAGIYLTVTMLFRISSIQVQTADGAQVTEIAGYSAESILQVLGLKEEENIFSFEPSAKEAVLERQFPLLESIRVERDYPNTVVVRVTEATPAYAVQGGSSWLVISDQFKILSTQSTQPEGLCTLYGGEVENAAPGEQLQFKGGTETPEETDSGADASASGSVQQAQTLYAADALTTLRDKLEEYGMLSDVTRMEFADTEEIAFLYQDRVSVLLGTLNDLDYKLDRARYVLNNEDGKGCAPTDTGRLDFSHISAGSTRKIYFAQGEPTLPSGYVVPPVSDTPAETADSTGEAASTAEAQDEAADTADTAQTEPAADETPLTDPARMTAAEDENPM